MFMPGNNTVLIFMFLAYCLAVIIGGLIVLDTQRRHLLQQRIYRLGRRMTNSMVNAGANIQQTSNLTRLHAYRFIIKTAAFFGQHKWHALAACMILAIPAVAMLWLEPSRTLPGYEDLSQTSDPVVLALLKGEQLAPPPPIAPEAFMTPEVAATRRDLAGASREWASLDADFRQRLLTVFHLMEKKGYPMALLEGYRSPERQNYLAGLGTQVTNAGAYQSFHQFGLAADSAFIRNGKLVISEKDLWAMQGYQLYGELAESVGLVWGGRWKMMDFGHVELRKSNTVLRSTKK
jgi:peptidoglycan L-alanyl-D-glutamate endopeptidase CwlK